MLMLISTSNYRGRQINQDWILTVTVKQQLEHLSPLSDIYVNGTVCVGRVHNPSYTFRFDWITWKWAWLSKYRALWSFSEILSSGGLFVSINTSLTWVIRPGGGGQRKIIYLPLTHTLCKYILLQMNIQAHSFYYITVLATTESQPNSQKRFT